MKFKRDDITFNGKSFVFKEGIWKKLNELFHDKEVLHETQKAERWLQYNHPKKNYTKFLCNWLNRAKNRFSDEYGEAREKENIPRSVVRQNEPKVIATLLEQYRQ